MHPKEEGEVIRLFIKKNQVKKRLVIVPERKSIPKGTLMAILEQAGLSREEFIEILKR